MIELAKRQTLRVVKKVEFGVYLAEGTENATENGTENESKRELKIEERVLLPIKQVPEGTQEGSEIEVFVYRDSEDRMIATTREPKVQLGEVAKLTVKDVNKFGAFLDWGLEKDLFLPFKQQTTRVQIGDDCLVALYIDKSSRLCATMKVYHYLPTNSPYHKEDKVTGRVYEISDNFGAFVAVDDQFSALIPKKEQYGDIRVNDFVTARVTRVLEDGKLELSVREKAYLQIGADAEKILKIIESFDGVLPFNDKANPEVIRRETGMSKNEFKRAVGNLLKAGKITIAEKSIRLTEND